MKKKKEVTLFWMFLKRVLLMATAIGAVFVVDILMFNIGINTGFILPANYTENYLKQNADRIIESVPFDASLIPEGCSYGLFDAEGNYKSGNLNEKWKATVTAAIEGTRKIPSALYIFERADGYCAVKYDVVVHFANPAWNRLIPNAEAGMISLFLLIMILNGVGRSF